MNSRTHLVWLGLLAGVLPSAALADIAPVEPVEPGPECGWTRTEQHPQGNFPPASTDACVNVFGVTLGSAVAHAWSVGTSAGGSGSAWDDSLFCDVRVQNVATDYFVESWSYKPCDGEQGWARATGHVQADGSVTLHTSNTGAVAVGYALSNCTLYGQVTAELTKSAAETSSSIIGEIGLEIEGVGGSVPIVVTTGTGTYPDNDVDGDVGEDCLNFFKVRRKCAAEMEFYADEGFFVARCDGSMSASASGSVTLGVCEDDSGPGDPGPGPEPVDEVDPK